MAGQTALQEEGSPRDPQTPRGPALGRSSPRSPPTGIGRACAAGSPTPCPAGESSAARRRPSGTLQFDGSRGMASEPSASPAAFRSGRVEDPGPDRCENRNGNGPTGPAHAPAGDNSRSIPTGLANPHRLPLGWGRRGTRKTAENCGPSMRASHPPRCRPRWPVDGGGATLPEERCRTPPGWVLRSCIGWYAVATVDPVGHCDSSGAGITRIT